MQLEQLGPYKLLRPIGRGGMGTVYAGVNAEGESAAIKVLSASLASEEGFRERFEIEIETLKKLNHPNIVRLHGYGEQDGHLYYVMELVDGTNLEEELSRGRRFNWREVTRFGIDLCKALKHAHDRGVIHRDIKPANLLLTRDGVIKLTDFGIARLFGNTRLTSEGGLLGTAEYMSPEQADGRRVTLHCDLYSLGSVLFALLAGRPPFQSNKLPEMLQLQRYAEPPPLRRLVPEAPEELERIIARLLAKEPEQRVPNAAILGKQLAAMEHGLSLIERTNVAVRPHESDFDFTLLPAGNQTQRPRENFDPLGVTRVLDGDEADPAGIDDAISLAPPTPYSPPATKGTTIASGTFTTVADEEESEEHQSKLNVAVLGQIAALAGCLLLVVLGIWYFLQPPTADRLFASLEQKALDRSELVGAKSEIDSFIERFPEDHRINIVRGYAEEAEVARAERQFQVKSRQMLRDHNLPPVQRDYTEAMSQADLDPQRSLTQLQALVQLYGSDEELEESSRVTIELAERQIRRLQEQLGESLGDRLKLIERKLAEAKAIAASDPQRAKSTLQSIIALYGDKSWADAQVERARAALAELDR